MSAAGPSRDDLLDALRAVLEALDIPHPVTAGDGEIHGEILAERTMHAVIALRNIMDSKCTPDVPWNVAYLRTKLAEHPAEGYKTWPELVAETKAARENDGVPEEMAPAEAFLPRVRCLRTVQGDEWPRQCGLPVDHEPTGECPGNPHARPAAGGQA